VLAVAVSAAGAALGTRHAAAQIAFAAEPSFVECTPSHFPTRARLFDMDGDGRQDLVLTGRNRDNLLNWVAINPDGSFGAMQSLEVAGQTDDALSADVDGDGTAELVLLVRAYSGRLQVLGRSGGGAMVPRSTTLLDREPRSMAAGDFDGDGDVDVAVSFYGSEHVGVLRNDGAGSFAFAQRTRVDPWSGGFPGPQDIRAVDVDSDGRADLVLGTLGTRRFEVLLGRADGTFAEPVAWLAPSFPGISSPAVVGFDIGDLDGDGDPDILAPLLSTGSSQPLVAFLNDGDGGFGERVLAGTTTGFAGYHWTAALCDFDGDGRLDAVSSTALPGAMFVWRNVTAGGAVRFEVAGRLEYSSFARDFLCVNSDGDCDPDVIVADIGGHYVLGFANLRQCLLGGEPVRRKAPAPSEAAGPELPVEPGATACDVALALAARGPAPSPAAPRQGAAFADPPPNCGPDGPGGRCDEPHATPGCFTTPCCEVVCGVIVACCEVAWDETCVELADAECRGMVCPSEGACDEVHEFPGCADPACCERITPLDGYCEGATWDWACVSRVLELCGLPPCTLSVPPGAVDEAEPCYDNLNDGATRDGEHELIACGQAFFGTCTTGAPRDTDWYSLGAGGPRRIRVTVDAEFPAEVHLVRGEFAGPLSVPETHFGGRCAPIVIDRCIDGGPWYAVVTLGQGAGPIRGGQECTEIDPDNPPPPDDPPVPGFDGVRYWIRHECLACAVFGDLDGDGRVSGSDLGLLLGMWGGRGAADLDGDGTVSGSDLGLLLGAWTGS
jgi:hypothetical protein